MSDTDSLAFIAKQLIELNKRLDTLTEVQTEIQTQSQESNRSLKMIRGWMEGQEEITTQQGKRLSNLQRIFSQLNEVATAHRDKLDLVLGHLNDLRTNLGGVAELGKSAYDIAVETKDKLAALPLSKDLGGAHEHEHTAATQ
jgi:chromosome segregation ATPase